MFQHTPASDKVIQDNVGKVSFAKIGEKLGITRNQVRGRYLILKNRRAKGAELPDAQRVFKVEGDENGQCFTSVDPDIKTVDQLIERRKIDLKVWKIDRFTIGEHEGFYRDTSKPIKDGDPQAGWRRTHKKVRMTAIKLWVKPRTTGEVATSFLREELIKAMREAAPSYAPIKRPPLDPIRRMMAEIAIFDAHFGKLAWAAETGENYDLKICTRDFLAAGEALLQQLTNYPIEKIVIPIGNDMLHVDNAAGTTTGGTKQDVDTRRAKAYLAAKLALIKLIEMARLIAPVHVVVVPGNHDRETMFFLGDTVESRFWNCPDVTVDNAPALRKYFEYGNTLLGFTHGSEEGKRLKDLMQLEQRQAWARIKHAEWHVGHMHIRRKRDTFIVDANTVDTDGGITTRWLPSLCATDAWHAMVGFVGGPRSAEAYLWDRKHGYAGHLAFNIDPAKRN